jgi:tRNA threonylcarbamoyladenosine biosynthesis protein TsaB
MLVIDTALGGIGLGAYNAQTDKRETLIFETEREQAAKLIPLIQDVLQGAGLSFADLGYIAVNTGPGSFTGIRVGMSTATTLAMTCDCPLIPLNSFRGVKASAEKAIGEKFDQTIAILETKRGEFYVQSFQGEQENGQGVSITGDALSDLVLKSTAQSVLLCGDGVERFLSEFPNHRENPQITLYPLSMIDPSVLMEAAQNAYASSNGEFADVKPFYIRGADVSVSRQSQRQIAD